MRTASAAEVAQRRIAWAMFRSLIALAAAAFFLYFLVDEVKAYNHFGEFETKLDLTTRIFALVHEFQKERGLSSLYIGANGKQGYQEVVDQRLLSDKQWQDITSFIDGCGVCNSWDPLREGITLAKATVTPLPSFRLRVDKVNVTRVEVLDFYTNIIDSWLQLTLLSSPGDYEQLSRLSQALVFFNYFKEMTGWERGTFAGIISTNYFASQEVLKRALYSQAKKDVHFSNFLATKAADFSSIYYSRMSGPAMVEATNNVNRMRTIVLSNYTIGPTLKFNLVPTEWWGNATAIIDMQFLLSNTYINTLQSTISSQKNDVVTKLVISVIGFVCDITASFSLLYLSYPIIKLLWEVKSMSHTTNSISSRRTANSQGTA